MNDHVYLEVPEVQSSNLKPLDIPLDIVYEDNDIAVINKQSGLIVHPGAGNSETTLVNSLLFNFNDLSGIGGIERPGIVHRLDKDTSGLIVIAKNDYSHRVLCKMFADRLILKEYHALVIGKPPSDNYLIEKSIARSKTQRHKMTVDLEGKYAKTEVWLEKNWNRFSLNFSLLRLRIYTGRTHQIRVHLMSDSMPIVGDDLYSKKAGAYPVEHLLLASTKLEFSHPVTMKLMSFEISLPDRFLKFIMELEKKS